jgi:hypothetical protein
VPAAVLPVAPVLQAPSGVQVEALPALDIDRMALLSAEEAGFPAESWSRLDRAEALSLIGGITSAPPRALYETTRRLLLAMPVVPPGEPRGALAAARADRLVALGAFADANRLLAAIPRASGIFSAARARSNLAWHGSDTRAACIEARELAENASSGPGERRGRVFCDRLSGSAAQASLGADLLREQALEDTAFFTLLDRIANRDQSLDQAVARDALHTAMFRAAGLAAPSSFFAGLGLGDLLAVALDGKVPLESRIFVAERVEAQGALPVSYLAELYGSVSFTAEELAKPVETAEAIGGWRGRALLFRIAQAETAASARAAAWSKFLELARREVGRYPGAARLAAGALKTLTPQPELEWFAADAARALLVGADGDFAPAWLELAAKSGGGNRHAAEQLTLLAHFVGLPLPGPPIGERFMAWKTGRSAAEAALLGGLLVASGAPLRAIAFAADGGASLSAATPSSWQWIGLADAARPEHKAEALLYALAALGTIDWASDPRAAIAVVRALYRAGFQAEARAFGLEIAIASGL